MTIGSPSVLSPRVNKWSLSSASVAADAGADWLYGLLLLSDQIKPPGTTPHISVASCCGADGE